MFFVPYRVQAIVLYDFSFEKELGLIREGCRVKFNLDKRIYDIFSVAFLFGYLRTTEDREFDLFFWYNFGITEEKG